MALEAAVAPGSSGAGEAAADTEGEVAADRSVGAGD